MLKHGADATLSRWFRASSRIGLLLSCCVLAFLQGGGVPSDVEAAPQPPANFVQFDGISSYLEIPDSPDFSVATTGALTVSAWMRPDTLTFPTTEGSGYVYWLGKGSPGNEEWVLRMYSQGNTENRANRISFYVFNPAGGLGIGSYVQEPVTAGEWMQIVGVANHGQIAIYKNGVSRRCDLYTGSSAGGCQHYAQDLWVTPQHGNAPLRMGTRDLHSFFQGALGEVRVWNRALSNDEIGALYASDVAPRNGLVAEYLLDQNAGTVVHDTAGGHDGTVFGATWSSAPQTPARETLAGSAQTVSFTPGQPVSAQLASITDSDAGVTADALSVSVDWGDGTSSAATLSGAGGSFQVSGSHVYNDVGPFTITLSVTNTASQAEGVVQTTATAS